MMLIVQILIFKKTTKKKKIVIMITKKKKNIQQCVKCVYGTGQKNAHILSYVNMIQELIAARDGLKLIQNMCNNAIIKFVLYISAIDVIYTIYFNINLLEFFSLTSSLFYILCTVIGIQEGAGVVSQYCYHPNEDLLNHYIFYTYLLFSHIFQTVKHILFFSIQLLLIHMNIQDINKVKQWHLEYFEIE